MKISTGAEFYDNDEAFLAYTKRRQQKENANDTIEKPAILQLLDDVTDADVLDLGCGNAGFGAELLAQGCFSYTGVDGSINMINAAQQQLSNYPNAEVIHEPMEHYTPPRDKYDLVTARLDGQLNELTIVHGEYGYAYTNSFKGYQNEGSVAMGAFLDELNSISVPDEYVHVQESIKESIQVLQGSFLEIANSLDNGVDFDLNHAFTLFTDGLAQLRLSLEVIFP